ncbi:protein NSP-INTERACTING KINASE 3 isoform X1 [Cinnamomum micranthum f. kanehirae]|uniref:Protein NSP-INTERACTING KINASE 3 isoform X1 n=1 Tax=Cinnamomum micranthum f. kanehirae TaxID=337451 RepID=A0A3S3QHP6_9MAGN|nr:protein NSP-INTERACTING KINASE 3 isoform X1 [Cinnamomum micranthum f. kanehirae]
MSPLLQLLLLFSCILSATSITFRCTTRPTCQGMIGYISPNTTTLSSIKDLFGLESVYSLLAANSWPTKDTNRSITAGSTVRIPFPCSCSNDTGISDRTPVYSLKPDDSLDYIARTIFGEFVTYQEIAAVNNVSDVNQLYIGQKLWIPLPCSCDDVDAARVVHYGHVVANGSSVSQIAGEFGTTVATLIGLNNETLSDPKNLKAGQILDVPIKACNSSTVSSLLVPNGSYALIANNCDQCSCNSNHLGLKCMRAQGVLGTMLAPCPSTQCGNLSLGESVDLTTCLRTTCDYAGYNARMILTVLTNQSTCTSRNADAGPKVNIKIIIGAISGAIGLFIACIVFVFLKKRFWKRTNDSNNNVKAFSLRQHPTKNVKAFLQNYGSLAPKQFRYSKLKKMTNSFKDKLGEGGYGGVFKGKLKDGRLVAVKVLNNSKGNGEEFINEVASIGRTSHVNIVTLLGFCFEGSKRALIYEFMSNGSLEKFIYSNKSRGAKRVLSCGKLLQIAVGIARGLEYLHRGCSTRILHFDIKPHNILLDDEFCPKISDFGLAKLCPKQESIISMQDARGTTGYIAPELYCRNIGRVSHKSDVYSYGMMVLEMVGGRRNIDAQAENTSETYFPHWVYNHIALENNINLTGIVEEEEKEIAKKMVLVGIWCIQTDPTNRPSMSRVVEMLEGSVHSLEMPPKPYLSSS